MICTLCKRETVMQKADHSGLMIPLCEDCELPPRTFAEGTQPGRDRWVAMTEQISIEQAEKNALRAVLQSLVTAFEREMSCGYATSEQQQALRAAKEALK